MDIDSNSASSLAASCSFRATDVVCEENASLKEQKQFAQFKKCFLQARRLKNYDDMLLLGQALNGLCNGQNLETIQYLAEALFVKREYARIICLLNKRSQMLNEDPQLMILYAESLLRMGGPNIKESLLFLEKVSSLWTDSQSYDLLKILLGEVYEMHDFQKKSLQIYKQLFTIRPIYPKIIKKLFGSFAFPVEEEIELIRQTKFSEENKWAMHLAVGLVSATRNMPPENVVHCNLLIPMKEKEEVHVEAPNSILFKSGSTIIKLKDVIACVDEAYPTPCLLGILKYSSFNISIQIRGAYQIGNYPHCYALCRLLVESLLINCLDILPIYINCCVLLGLSAEIRLLTERMMHEKVDDALVYFAKGSFFLMKSDYEKAIKCFKASTDCCKELYNSVFLASQVALGHSLSFNNATDQALRAYHLAASIFSGYYAPYLYMGMEFTKQGCYNEAMECLQYARHLAPRNGQIQHEIGVVFLKTRQFDVAIYHFKEAVDYILKSPHMFSDIYYCMLGKAYFDKAVFDKSLSGDELKDAILNAFKILQKAMHSNFGNSCTSALLGLCEYYLGHIKTAQEHLNWALNDNLGSTLVREALNHLYQSTLHDNHFTYFKRDDDYPNNIIYFDNTNAILKSEEPENVQLASSYATSSHLDTQFLEYFDSTASNFTSSKRMEANLSILIDNEWVKQQIQNARKESKAFKAFFKPSAGRISSFFSAGVFERIHRKFDARSF